MHTPVFLSEVGQFLEVKKDHLYIDATAGNGGHLEEIIKKGGRVLAIEWDKEHYQKLKIKNKKLLVEKKLILVNENFKNIKKIAMKNNFLPVDGVLFDLGLSATQIFESGRGFSYKKKSEPLDMRINSSTNLTAADLVNNLNKDELYQIFARYGEEINSLSITKAILAARKIKKIKTVDDLIQIISRVVGQKEKVYARIFQSLRIAVNNELDNLKQGLIGALKILKPNGKLIVISFHSVEDRIVKKFINENNLKTKKKKPIMAKNEKKFERSAKLRVIYKNEN